MITGFNTDIDHQGRIFHVQTEEKGQGNPTIETLIYTGGEIVTCRKSSYEDLLGPLCTEDEILRRMEVQHQAMIREVFNGRYDTEGPLPFGYNIVSNRSLDEVVLAFLEEHGSAELAAPSVLDPVDPATRDAAEPVPAESVDASPIRLQIIDHQTLLAGTRPTLRLKVLDQATARPIGGARVRVQMLLGEDGSRELFSADTDGEGFLEASFEIPSSPGAPRTIVCVAEVDGAHAEYRQVVERS